MGEEFEKRKEDLTNLQQMIKKVDPNNEVYNDSLKNIDDLLEKMDSQESSLSSTNEDENNDELLMKKKPI